MALWVEISLQFEKAFRVHNDDLVQRFFRYAEWCIDTAQPLPTDVSTAAWCAFYEDLPQISGLAGQLHRFLSRQRFLHLQDAFRYHIDESEFVRFRDTFLANSK